MPRAIKSPMKSGKAKLKAAVKKVAQYAGMEKYSSKKAEMKHERQEGKSMEIKEKSMYAKSQPKPKSPKPKSTKLELGPKKKMMTKTIEPLKMKKTVTLIKKKK
jgi:hypothetical protein